MEQVSVSAFFFCCFAYRGNTIQSGGGCMGWDEKRVEHLKKLWADGYSCSQIAARMGGLTRNAVIGKVSRLGLPSRPTAFRTPTSKKRRPRSLNRPTWRWGKPKSLVPIPTEPLPPPHETDIPRKSFLELDERRDCKFICGEPKGPFEKQFCGEPRVEGLPYCEVHSVRCFNPPQPRASRPARPKVPTFQVYIEETV